MSDRVDNFDAAEYPRRPRNVQLQSNHVAIKPGVMPYALRFFLYLFIPGLVAFVLAIWLAPLELVVNDVFVSYQD